MVSIPDASEYAPYFGRYIGQVEAKELFTALEGGLAKTLGLLGGLSDEQALHRYGPDKWSIKEVIGHLIDAERIFAYRALRFARNDATPLASFDENAFVSNARFDDVALRELAESYEMTRRSHLCFFRQLNEEEWNRVGTASNNRMSVRALAWTIAGHEVHHLRIIESRYLPQISNARL